MMCNYSISQPWVPHGDWNCCGHSGDSVTVVVYWNCTGGVACCPAGWLAVLAADALAMSRRNCVSTGWLRYVSRASRISLKKRSGFSTSRWASFSGRSSTIAIRISSHSLGMRAGLPACICWMMATALFSHRVRAPSSLVRWAKVELRGGHVQACQARKKGLSGAFFPSCASVALARSSHLVVLMNELRKCIHCIPLWGFKSEAKSLQSGASSNKDTTKNKTPTTHNPHPKQHQTKTKRKGEHGMTAPKSNGIKCFRISRSCTKTSRQQTKRQQRKITRRCSAKHIDQQCRNPESPLPGSRRSHWGAFRHKTPSQ